MMPKKGLVQRVKVVSWLLPFAVIAYLLYMNRLGDWFMAKAHYVDYELETYGG